MLVAGTHHEAVAARDRECLAVAIGDAAPGEHAEHSEGVLMDVGRRLSMGAANVDGRGEGRLVVDGISNQRHAVGIFRRKPRLKVQRNHH